MIQFQWNVWTDKRKDNKQIIFHTTFPATAWGPKTKISIDSLQRYQRILRFSWIRLKTELTQPVSDLTFPWWLSPYKKSQVSIGINLRYPSRDIDHQRILQSHWLTFWAINWVPDFFQTFGTSRTLSHTIFGIKILLRRNLWTFSAK